MLAKSKPLSKPVKAGLWVAGILTLPFIATIIFAVFMHFYEVCLEAPNANYCPVNVQDRSVASEAK